MLGGGLLGDGDHSAEQLHAHRALKPYLRTVIAPGPSGVFQNAREGSVS